MLDAPVACGANAGSGRVVPGGLLIGGSGTVSRRHCPAASAARCSLDSAMPARQLEAKAISPESGKGFSRKNDCESSRIVARSVRLMRRPMTMRIAITAAALGAMVWLVGAASSSAQDRPAPDCLLTYANGQFVRADLDPRSIQVRRLPAR